MYKSRTLSLCIYAKLGLWKVKQMKEELMWRGVIECNPDYDGRYFYGVKTTGVFCRPSCKSRNPKRDNIRYFERREEALAEGYRPCKRCRPDLFQFNPNQEVAQKLKDRLSQVYYSDSKIVEVINDFNFSQHRLIQIYKEYYGITIRQYIIERRINQAMMQLRTTEKRIVDIALDVGFNSSSAFYSAFNSYAGMSPSQYRNSEKTSS